MRLIRHKINFNRKFPDHRMPVDYESMQKDRNMFDWARLYWEGFVSMLHKNGPIYVTYLSLFAGFFLHLGLFANVKTDHKTLLELGHINHNHSGRRYSSVRRVYKQAGRYDNITGRFENQPGGNLDLPHNEI